MGKLLRYTGSRWVIPDQGRKTSIVCKVKPDVRGRNRKLYDLEMISSWPLNKIFRITEGGALQLMRGHDAHFSSMYNLYKKLMGRRWFIAHWIEEPDYEYDANNSISRDTTEPFISVNCSNKTEIEVAMLYGPRLYVSRKRDINNLGDVPPQWATRKFNNGRPLVREPRHYSGNIRVVDNSI